MSDIIYLDNQASTRVDPRVVEAMLPIYDVDYGNIGSSTHSIGMSALEIFEESSERIAELLGADTAEDFLFTSGATEANNLAVFGACGDELKRKHVVTVKTEHPAPLRPCERLMRHGFEITYLDVADKDSPCPGLISLDQLEDSIRDDTILVSVMYANNEIGVIQPLKEIGEICQRRGVLFHTDATQAVGKVPFALRDLPVDLFSFSVHKVHGPKGVGALYVRGLDSRIKLTPQVIGGGQQQGFRSGTMNLPCIVGLRETLELAMGNEVETDRIATLRDRLYERICKGLGRSVGELPVNGPKLADREHRLGGSLNLQFPDINAQSLMTMTDGVAMSSGSACASADPQPSHVLAAIGLNPAEINSSIRLSLGRFNDEAQIDAAADQIVESALKLQKLQSCP